MAQRVTKKQVIKLVGKNIIAVKKDGTSVSGRLVHVSGNRLIVEPRKGKKVQTKALIPLVLFDLLAIGTAPYVYGYPGYPAYPAKPYGAGYGHGYGPGYGPVGPYPYRPF